jgi:hypothetical protein
MSILKIEGINFISSSSSAIPAPAIASQLAIATSGSSRAGQRRFRTETQLRSASLVHANVEIDPNDADEIARLIMEYGCKGGAAIYYAAQANDEKAVKLLLSYGGDPSAALQGAVQGKSLALVQYLTEIANVKVENILYNAAGVEWWEGFDYFLQRGEKITTSLVLTYLREPRIIQQLVSRGIKFNYPIPDNYWSQTGIFSESFDPVLRREIFNAFPKEAGLPLDGGYLYAMIGNAPKKRPANIPVLTFKERHLLKPPNGNGFFQITPLQYAVLTNDTVLAEAMLKAGANPDFENPTPLKIAKVQGNAQMISLLIRYGAKVDGA